MSTKSKPRKKRRVNKRGGSGRGFGPGVAEHVMEKHQEDLKKQAAKNVDLVVVSSTSALEVLPGVAARAFVPALNRDGTGSEVTAVLEQARLERSEIDVPRKDRAGATRPYKPAGALEFAHGQLAIYLLLAIRWGIQQGLPSVNGLFDLILRKVPATLKEVYGEGLDTLVAALHVPNPFLEEALKEKGWRGSIPDPTPSDKIGSWNVHIQIYVARVRDRVFTTARHLFWHAGSYVVSSLQLREQGIDLDEHRAAKFAAFRGAAYHKGIETEGKEGMILPQGLRKKVAAGVITQAEAIKLAVSADLKEKAVSFEGAKLSRSLNELNERQVKEADSNQAIDLVLARWFTQEVEKGLRTLDPRYGPLIDEGRRVFRELKKRQMDCGHTMTLNELLTLWERERDAQLKRRKEVEREMWREAWQAGLPIAEWASEEERHVIESELAALREAELRTTLEREHAVALAREGALRATLESTNRRAEEQRTANLKHQSRVLFELMQIVSAVREMNSGGTPLFKESWILDEVVDSHGTRWFLGHSFWTRLGDIALFPEEVATLREEALSLSNEEIDAVNHKPRETKDLARGQKSLSTAQEKPKVLHNTLPPKTEAWPKRD